MPVVKLDITQREPFANGESFDPAGPYEYLRGTAHFAVDPLHPRNAAITDLELAPREADGTVAFSAQFAMLQPADPERGNRRMFFDVMNRGRKTVLPRFNDAPDIVDHSLPPKPGNGFLMRRGYTVVWCGWQADVPPTPGLMGLQAPEALGPQGSLQGRILCQFQVNELTSQLLLSDREHTPHPAADVNEAEALLQVRDHPNAPATEIPRAAWSFVRMDGDAAPNYVHLHAGFEPGHIYQLVYTTRGSRIVGLGFAAVRDIASFLKHGSAGDGNPCAGRLDYAYAFGASQSGRFLRQMLYHGLMEDEAERLALDGVVPHVAGGMRGEFNLRFGQPSKDVCFIIPEMFPFTDTPQTDPLTGRRGSLLEKPEARGKVAQGHVHQHVGRVLARRRGAHPHRPGNDARPAGIAVGAALPFFRYAPHLWAIPPRRVANRRRHARAIAVQHGRFQPAPARRPDQPRPLGQRGDTGSRQPPSVLE